MSSDGRTNTSHIAGTDHCTRRGPDRLGPGTTRPPPPGQMPIEAFHRGGPSNESRDLGVALAGLVRRGEAGAPQARLALPLLELATREQPDDYDAWEAQ